MKRVLILAEGQTEDAFIREVLAPHLWQRDIDPIPTLVVTKFVKSGPRFQGGLSSYDPVRRNVWKLLNDTHATLVTTMLDYYGLPTDFPGMNTRPAGNGYVRVKHVEESFQQDIGHHHFAPYLALHEFEAFVFVDPARCPTAFMEERVVQQLVQERQGFGSPEEINERPMYAPSKRVLKIFPAYQKTLHGPLATMDLGMEALRSTCPHFDEWVSRLEAL
jgi:hypothetical protein